MSATAGPLEFRQRYADNIEAMQTHLDGRQAQIHTALPGHIVSYNPATQTASVQFGVQAIHQQIDGTIKPVTIHPVSDVPVHFPNGGGHTMTFPVKPGDECLVIFSERNIDNWHQSGGTQQPGDYRMHDINDCFVLVGVRSQPNVLSNVSADTVQLRSDNGETYIELDGAGSAVNIRCPGTIKLDCVTLHVTGTINCDSEVIAQANTMGFVTLSKHLKHSGTPSQPTPGT
jgi:Phage protein Gp138 N-terminal domain